ncbi:MAG: carboxypeptidase regulatory-like domain-containing protein [Anaerolineae bacterium]|nr:carboxypeptidase regulatory-like domain-containing protein [Anaerolineae bacterium]
MNSSGVLLPEKILYLMNIANGQSWMVKTYAEGPVKSDIYYQENLVISDLPAGRYEVKISFLGKWHTVEVDLYPGRVTYFNFNGYHSFDTLPPPIPGQEFKPNIP